MRKTLLLTTVFVMAVGLLFAWADQGTNVNNLITNKAPAPISKEVVQDRVAPAEQIAAEPALTPEEQAKLAAEADKAPVPVTAVNPQPRQHEVQSEVTVLKEEQNQAELDKVRMAEIKADGVISANEQAEYDAIAKRMSDQNGGGQEPVILDENVSEVEPNDDCTTQTPIACGDRVFCANIGISGDAYDYFTFTLDDTYTAWTVICSTYTAGTDCGTLDDVDTQMNLYDDNCANLLEFDDDDGPGLYSKIVYFDLAPGTYNVAINPYSTGSGNYHMRLACEPYVLPPVGDVCADPIIVPESFPYSDSKDGCTYYNDYGNGGPDIIYEMTLTSQTYLSFTLENSPDWWYNYLWLESDAQCGLGYGGYLAYDYGYTDGDFATVIYDCPAGTYYIMVDGSTTPPCGNYTLDIDIYTPPEPPPNDNCADAIAIGDGTYIIDNTMNASDDGEGVENIHRNVWYCYTASADGTAHIDLCSCDYDTKVAAYDGCTCSPLGTELGFNDDSSVCDGRALQSYLTIPVVSGQTYLIEAGSYSTTGYGYFEMTVTLVPSGEPPANDDCANAEEIAGPYPATGTGTCANATVDCPGVLDWNGVWYYFDLPYTSNDVTITICGETADLYNVGVVLMDDCACDDYILYSGITWLYDICPSGYVGAEITYSQVPGGARSTIYWPALAEDNTYTGIDFSYTVDVQEHVVNPGDDCSNPLAVSLPPGTWPYQDLGQTTCGRVNDYSGVTCLGSYDGGEDIIYELTVASPMVVDITMDPYADTWTGIAVSTDCPPTDCIAMQTGSSGVRTLTGVILLTGTYYIMVDTWPSPNCITTFDLTIAQGAEPPGACCSGDPEAPTCDEDVTQLDCMVNMGGYSWVEGGTCPDACPPLLPGAVCELPIEVTINSTGDLPYVDDNTTCGMGNDYDATCLGSYDGGEDIIYEVTLGADMTLDFLVTSDATWVGIGIDTNCPLAGTCLDYATSSGSSVNMTGVPLTAGTYYVMIDTWPSPDCIPNFTLTIQETPPPPENDNCEDATVIGNVTDLPFSTLYATHDGPTDCMTSNNVWFSYTATCDGRLTVDLLGSGFDTKLGIWAGSVCPPTELVVCNDDYDGTLQSGAVIRVNTGEEYLFEVGGYSSNSGIGDITVACEELCQVECPPDPYYEGELCGDDSNGGCNDPDGGYPMEPIVCGDVVCGTCWSDLSTRDTDWYTFDVAAPGGHITWSLTAEFPSQALILQGDCVTGYTQLGLATADDCETATIELDLAAGTYWAWAGPSTWFDMPCGEGGVYGNDYYAELTCEIGTPVFSVDPTSIEDNTDDGCVQEDVLTVDNVGDAGSRLTFDVNVSMTPLLGMFPGAPVSHNHPSANSVMPTDKADEVPPFALSLNKDAEPGKPSGTLLDPPANDDCANAEDITGTYPVTGTGTCIDATDDCPALFGAGWAGVWYMFDLPYDENNVTITICGESADLYNVGVVLMNDCLCDDYVLYTSYLWLTSGECSSGYDGIEITFGNLAGGTWYWPALAQDVSLLGIDFSYTIEVEEVVPCVINCEDYDITMDEGEPDCGPEYDDTYNGGCNSDIYVFQDVPCNAVICGTYGGFTFAGGSYRDTDWYRLVVEEHSVLTWSIIGEAPSLIFLMDAGSEDCVDYVVINSMTADPCEIASITADVEPGVYWLWAGTSVFGPDPYGCPLTYVATISCVPYWLTVDVTHGSIGEGEGPVDVTVTLDATNLEVGNTYYGNVQFVTNEGAFVTDVHDVPVTFDHTTPCGPSEFAYLQGDANMYNEYVDVGNPLTGPWRVGGDVTFLVNYFDITSGNQPCLMYNPNNTDDYPGGPVNGYYFASADATGEGIVSGGDVSRLVAYFGGTAAVKWYGWDKPDPENYYPPMWLNNRGSGLDQPVPPLDELPAGWPNCQVPPPGLSGVKVIPTSPSK